MHQLCLRRTGRELTYNKVCTGTILFEEEKEDG